MGLFSLPRLGVCVLNKVTLQPSNCSNAADHEAMSLLKKVCLQTVTVTGNLEPLAGHDSKGIQWHSRHFSTWNVPVAATAEQ